MSELVIVGRYPFPDRKLEGMVQRIADIDARLEDRPRTYLDLYALKHLRSSLTPLGLTTIYTASFLHLWMIAGILRRAKEVYVHSIYFYALILLPLLLAGRRARLVLDLHGTVPEEIRHTGNRWLAAMMSLVERMAFARIDLAICVTRQMEAFYRGKYPDSGTSYLYLPIFTAQVCQPANPVSVAALQSRLRIPNEAVVFLYSGGLQAWQNIDRTLDATKSLLDDPLNWFIFLTGETEALLHELTARFGDIPERVIVAHASPNELRSYYELASFGFILREDHILNRVANPTKLVEYLYFGMRPIVLSPHIGDFVQLGYEYLPIEEVANASRARQKSKLNRQISLTLLADAQSANLAKHLQG